MGWELLAVPDLVPLQGHRIVIPYSALLLLFPHSITFLEYGKLLEIIHCSLIIKLFTLLCLLKDQPKLSHLFGVRDFKAISSALHLFIGVR